jgi:hypothetical protein
MHRSGSQWHVHAFEEDSRNAAPSVTRVSRVISYLQQGGGLAWHNSTIHFSHYAAAKKFDFIFAAPSACSSNAFASGLNCGCPKNPCRPPARRFEKRSSLSVVVRFTCLRYASKGCRAAGTHSDRPQRRVLVSGFLAPCSRPDVPARRITVGCCGKRPLVVLPTRVDS